MGTINVLKNDINYEHFNNNKTKTFRLGIKPDKYHENISFSIIDVTKNV